VGLGHGDQGLLCGPWALAEAKRVLGVSEQAQGAGTPLVHQQYTSGTLQGKGRTVGPSKAFSGVAHRHMAREQGRNRQGKQGEEAGEHPLGMPMVHPGEGEKGRAAPLLLCARLHQLRRARLLRVQVLCSLLSRCVSKESEA